MIGLIRAIRDYRKNHRLSARLLGYILLISSLLTLVGTGLQIYNDYRNDIGQIHADIQTIEKSFLQPLANSVWNLDLEQVEVQLQGALKLRDMIYAEVREVRKGESLPLTSRGKFDADSSITERFPLIYRSGDFSAQVGELQATFSLKGVYARLQEKVALVLATQFIKTFIVSLCILAAIHYLITRHLTQLSALAAKINFNNLNKHWKLNRKKSDHNKKDELDRLVYSFNAMQDNLHQHLQKRNEAEAALLKQQQELENIVAKRTEELVDNMKLLEREVKIRIDSEQRADKANRAKSEFLTNMSHEIRTPMNAVLGFAQLLAEEERDPIKARHLDSILSGGKTLLHLIDNVLNLSKIESGKLDLNLGPVSIPHLFQEMEQMFNKQILDKNLELQLDVDQKLPDSLLLDEPRLRQILINLIGNALKFTQQGHISVKASFQKLSQDSDQLDLSLQVTDTGIGIPDDQLEHIFGAFQQRSGQDSNVYGGTGLGLAISRQLVEIMGGETTVTSTWGKGTSFLINLPRTTIVKKAPQPAPQETPPITAYLRFEPARVLICDDNETNRYVLKSFLQPWEQSLELHMACDGQEAISVAQQVKPDLILMDLKMPVIDGFTATKTIKSDPNLADIPVVIITAAMMVDQEDEIKRCCQGFLRKPLNRDDFIAACIEFLPHNYLSSATENKDQQPLDLDSQSLSQSPLLLLRLREELSQVRDLSRKVVIQDIERFARKTDALATEYESPPLAQWSQRLTQAAAHFDSQQIANLFDLYISAVEER